jgi:hypothetical protein
MTAPTRNLSAVLNGAIERIHLAENRPTAGPDFTNCSKAEVQETPVRQGPQRLKRVPFVVSRLMEFCTRRELVNQTGHDIFEWPLVILKTHRQRHRRLRRGRDRADHFRHRDEERINHRSRQRPRHSG